VEDAENSKTIKLDQILSLISLSFSASTNPPKLVEDLD